ncbi:MAG: DNA topoisomerase I [Candidatus Woesearchaeota archaeon]
MGYELIISEKPSQSEKIAQALADKKPAKVSDNGVNYYSLTHEGKEIICASAVGHVYSLEEKNKTFEYPVFDIEWKPAYEVDKNSAHTKKYISVLKKLAKNATSFTIATDFDVEGEVIGWNALRFACNQKDAQRMKFSTLTKPDLEKSYAKKLKTLEWGQAKAGETRHFLDWMYGINISRALTTALKKAGIWKSLSSGRVQGPALKLVVDKEKEIMKFIPEPYWQITYTGKLDSAEIEALHEKDKFTDENVAKKIFEKINKNDGTITKIEKTEKIVPPPFPFDLTTLQTEAYRSLKISPKDTLALAQELYSNGWISYPRTSSQELPEELDYKKLLSGLLRHDIYKHLAEKILAMPKLKPNNGPKKDPAHPAIYPTGILPDLKKINERALKIYDLIVRRFLSTFATDAKRETNKIIFEVKKENFITKGTRTIVEGWFEFYGKHVKLDDVTLPKVEINEIIKYKKAEILSKQTTPPKRYSPSSLIKELEKRNLGTKATRANIIETLYQRDFIEEKSLTATEMGIQIIDTLEKYCPEMIREELTRHFEEEMELIRENKSSEEKILGEAKVELTKILEKVKKHEKEIGDNLKESLQEMQDVQNTVGECPKCKKGTLMIKYSPKTKQKFIGCDRYPDCDAIFSAPKATKLMGAGKNCEVCGYPLLSVTHGGRTSLVCFNMECKSKLNEHDHDPSVKKLLNNPCPKCGSKLAMRKSFYGEFIGCTNYPKCHYMCKLDGEEIISKANKTKSKSATETKNKSKTTKTVKKITKKTTKKTSKN